MNLQKFLRNYVNLILFVNVNRVNSIRECVNLIYFQKLLLIKLDQLNRVVNCPTKQRFGLVNDPLRQAVCLQLVQWQEIDPSFQLAHFEDDGGSLIVFSHNVEEPVARNGLKGLVEPWAFDLNLGEKLCGLPSYGIEDICR